MSHFTWWQAVIIGASGGLTVWLVNFIREQILIARDKSRILKHIEQYRESGKSVWRFRHTWSIASHVNLTEDRVRFICSIHPKIKRSEEEGEVWRLVTDVAESQGLA